MTVRRRRAGLQGRTVNVRDRVALMSSPETIGTVIARDGARRAKVTWSQYTTTWVDIASLVIRVRLPINK
jgi:hypothetical protein